MKILLAVDGSPISTRAAKFVVRLASRLAEPPEVILFNADLPMLQGVTAKLGAKAVARYHTENNEFMLKPARRVLAASKLVVTEEPHVSEPAAAIIKVAKQYKVDLIVMGSKGNGALKGLVLGSVSNRVIAQAPVPVTIVR
ncbi:MAG: universal stress protein [Luteimonas sp.]